MRRTLLADATGEGRGVVAACMPAGMRRAGPASLHSECTLTGWRCLDCSQELFHGSGEHRPQTQRWTHPRACLPSLLAFPARSLALQINTRPPKHSTPFLLHRTLSTSNRQFSTSVLTQVLVVHSLSPSSDIHQYHPQHFTLTNSLANMRYSLALLAVAIGVQAAPQASSYSVQPITQISDGQIQAPPATETPAVPSGTEVGKSTVTLLSYLSTID